MDVRAVVLIGGGEPLMHPATAAVAERLSRASVAVGLVTNGTLLDRHLDVLRGSLSWLRVSLDAATPETYGAVRPGHRGVNKFAKVLANIRLVTGHHTLKVGISYVVFTPRPGSPCRTSRRSPAPRRSRWTWAVTTSSSRRNSPTITRSRRSTPARWT